MTKLLDQIEPAPAPCPEGFVPFNDGSMTGEMFQAWLGIRAMTCGPRLFYDASTGEPLSDHEILVRIFDGSTIDPAVIPLPGTTLLLLSALILWRIISGTKNQ